MLGWFPTPRNTQTWSHQLHFEDNWWCSIASLWNWHSLLSHCWLWLPPGLHTCPWSSFVVSLISQEHGMRFSHIEWSTVFWFSYWCSFPLAQDFLHFGSILQVGWSYWFYIVHVYILFIVQCFNWFSSFSMSGTFLDAKVCAIYSSCSLCLPNNRNSYIFIGWVDRCIVGQ